MGFARQNRCDDIRRAPTPKASDKVHNEVGWGPFYRIAFATGVGRAGV
jgi:hypothetical protein